MANILSFSSQVVRGHVGNSVSQFVLQRLGHEVWGLPSVLLSNHPGHKNFGGARLNSKTLRPVLEALEMSGRLKKVDALITGYLPTREHVFIAYDLFDMVRRSNPDAIYLYDPAMGEDARPGKPEGLYIDVKAAELQRTELLPHADIVTPNRFELEWLTMRPVLDIASALAAIEFLGASNVLATSIPADGGQLANLLSCDEGAFVSSTRRRELVPHGTGDMLAALYLGARLNGEPETRALGFASAAVEAVLRESEGRDELALIKSQHLWANAEPLEVTSAKEIA